MYKKLLWVSDIFTSAIAFIGFKIGLRPADKNHPYGHGKAEPLAGLLIVIFLVVISYEIFLEVFQKLTLGKTSSRSSGGSEIDELIYRMTRDMEDLRRKNQELSDRLNDFERQFNQLRDLINRK